MEQAILFGKYSHLVGISNIVTDNNDDHQKTAMILITAGMLHSVGPYRLYVDIASDLAEQGISSLRFDISGIGDSLGVGTSGKSINRAASEASEAMDYLTDHYGYENFIIFGLCSGADDGIQTALNDKRVKGVINLDGLGYKTRQFTLRHLLLLGKKMLFPSKWVNLLRNLTSSALAPASLATGNDIREFPETADQASFELQQLVDRDMQLHFIYTGGTYYYNYAQQFYDMLPKMNWKGTESTIYYPHMDHTATLCEDRKQIVDNISRKTLEMIMTISTSTSS